MNISIFYHTLFYKDSRHNLLPSARDITIDQMAELQSSGLLDAASEIIIGVNGGIESEELANNILPQKAKLIYHGLENKNENLTIAEIEKWIPGHEDHFVLYFHCKGGSYVPNHGFTTAWRNCMMKHLIANWKQCVNDLNSGYDAVGCHWLTKQQYPTLINIPIFGGNFWWAKASFLDTLPPIREASAVTLHGIQSHSSRYEAEAWFGNGKQIPKIKDYHHTWPDLYRCTDSWRN